VKNRLARILLALFCVCTLPAWKGLERQPALPPVSANEAIVGGMPDVRYAIYQRSGIENLLKDLEATLRVMNRDKPGAPINYLSISGGGSRGAFGAGLLNGWSKHGNRPEFNMVTGISTGALMAPFAFLGPAYDAPLKELYTNITAQNIYKKRNYTAILLSDGLSDTKPLYELIARQITPELLRKVAYEYQVRHRWLLIGTTNLDTGQPIIWNMGKIASYDTAEALMLFRQVMLASASLPGFFSPVMLNVVFDGQHYQEMHVDGGVSRQVFIYPASLFHETGAYKLLEGRKREAYFIRNDILEAEKYQTVERQTLAIANQALTQFAHSHGDGDILMAYLTARQDGFGFNMAFATDDFVHSTPDQRFDRDYMVALFNYAEGLAEKGYPWSKVPPGLNESLSTSLLKYREVINGENGKK
jgi:predicted patatin/cPLA2 family phospholipase